MGQGPWSQFSDHNSRLVPSAGLSCIHYVIAIVMAVAIFEFCAMNLLKATTYSEAEVRETRILKPFLRNLLSTVFIS